MAARTSTARQPASRALPLQRYTYVLYGLLAAVFVTLLWVREHLYHRNARQPAVLHTDPRHGFNFSRAFHLGHVAVAELPHHHHNLTKELALRHARDNVLIVTWTNGDFMDFTENWAKHLHEVDARNILVGAADIDAAERLHDLQLPYFAMFNASATNDTGLGGDPIAWGSARFHQMDRQRIASLSHIMTFGIDVLLCDNDMVWLKDPVPFFARYPTADMLTSSDMLTSTLEHGDDGIERPLAGVYTMNMGIVFLRWSMRSRQFVDEWSQVVHDDPSVWAQLAFNRLAKRGFNPNSTHPSNRRLFYAYDEQLIVGVLPVATFANGHTYHVQHLEKKLAVAPYMVHQTFQYGGTPGKRLRLQEALLWKVEEPSYYSEPRFLHVELATLAAPKNFEVRTDYYMQLFHLQNMEFQLLQVRQALAIAVITNRTIVMPRMQCYCDRFWGPVESCRFPGAKQMGLPFVCPMDHILEPAHFTDAPEHFGPPIPFREYSFFDNPMVPAEVKSDAIAVTVDEGLPPGQTTRAGQTLALPPNSTHYQITRALGSLDNHVIRLRFERLLSPATNSSSFSRFFAEPLQPERLQRAFEWRLQHLPGIWCCRKLLNGGGQGREATSYRPMLMQQGIENVDLASTAASRLHFAHHEKRTPRLRAVRR